MDSVQEKLSKIAINEGESKAKLGNVVLASKKARNTRGTKVTIETNLRQLGRFRSNYARFQIEFQ